jgi:hypothetical protein
MFFDVGASGRLSTLRGASRGLMGLLKRTTSLTDGGWAVQFGVLTGVAKHLDEEDGGSRGRKPGSDANRVNGAALQNPVGFAVV